MPTKLTNTRTKEQFWKLYQGLPQELKDALFAPETGDYIEEICTKNNIEKISEIVELVGQVLLGLVLPEDFQAILEKEMKIKKDVAKNISHEINRFIFYPVKEVLSGLHKIEAAPANGMPSGMPLPAKPTIKKTEEKIPEIATAPEPTTKKADIYKEEVE